MKVNVAIQNSYYRYFLVFDATTMGDTPLTKHDMSIIASIADDRACNTAACQRRACNTAACQRRTSSCRCDNNAKLLTANSDRKATPMHLAESHTCTCVCVRAHALCMCIIMYNYCTCTCRLHMASTTVTSCLTSQTRHSQNRDIL